jgi:hypothetical protein
MDSAGDDATLSCHRAPCGWVSRHEHVKMVIAREGLRAAGLNCVFEVPMLILNSDCSHSAALCDGSLARTSCTNERVGTPVSSAPPFRGSQGCCSCTDQVHSRVHCPCTSEVHGNSTKFIS